MRSLLVIGLMVMSVGVMGQNVKVHMDNGTEDGEFVNDVIKAHTDDAIICQLGTYKLEKLKAVLFFQQPSDALSEKLIKSGVKVIDRWSDPMYAGQYSTRYESKVIMIPKYESTKQGAILFQILGVGAVAAATVLSVSDLPENASLDDIKARRNNVKTLSIGGGIGFALGTIFKAEAEKDIRDALHPDL